MRKYLGLIIGIGVIGIIAMWAMSFYNGTISANENVEKVWGDVLVRYQERGACRSAALWRLAASGSYVAAFFMG